MSRVLEQALAIIHDLPGSEEGVKEATTRLNNAGFTVSEEGVNALFKMLNLNQVQQKRKKAQKQAAPTSEHA